MCQFTVSSYRAVFPNLGDLTFLLGDAKISKKELYQFPRLLSIKNEINCTDIKKFVDHINNLKKDIEGSFIDILDLKINDWMTDPFSADIAC
ncbi:hypothetical protein A3Q56_07399 [Intoshia linei]|uniref:Uncharacterized protein n=1 Tax=Intoshia linei TaxID=1819745 RepID=A0A177ATF4_9BILA|nr:hypothetical protein A3Q56_07399 [Intoshia linei]